MANLIKADFYKALRSKALYICTGFCIVFGAIMIIAMKTMMNRAEKGRMDPRESAQALEMANSASGLWAMTFSFAGGFISIFAGVFVAMFVSSEFHYGTMKNMLSKGADRTKVYLSKFIVATCASLIMLIVAMLTTFILGSIMWGVGTAGAGGVIGMILTQMLLMIAFAAFFTFISMTIRSMGGSLATNIVCVALASTLLGFVNMLFNIKINGTALNFADYWIGGAISNLATTTPTTTNIVTGIIVALAWGIASMVGGMLHFKKVDVK